MNNSEVTTCSNSQSHPSDSVTLEMLKSISDEMDDILLKSFPQEWIDQLGREDSLKLATAHPVGKIGDATILESKRCDRGEFFVATKDKLFHVKSSEQILEPPRFAWRGHRFSFDFWMQK